MTRLQRSVYFDICLYCWDHVAECPDATLSALLADISDWRTVVDQLVALDKIYRRSNGDVGNVRALEEGRRALKLCLQRRKGGLNRHHKAVLKGGVKFNGVRQNTETSTPAAVLQQSCSTPPESRVEKSRVDSDSVSFFSKKNLSQRARTRARGTGRALTLPDWISQEAWNGWVATRAKLRKPLTDRAIELSLAKLAKMREEGHDANAVLDQSTAHGWLGLFPLKAEPAPATPKVRKPETEDEYWERRLCERDRFPNFWLSSDGPEPGKPGCRIPARVLEAHRPRAADAANGGSR